jgi:hypothetical protein
MKSTGRFTDELRRLMARSYDSCQGCGAKLPREVAAFAGYAVDGSPLYVGACCEQLIAELATHVYWWWEVDKRCEPETRLWRYMDFAKFLAMLEQRSIYFARADMLGDPFEGASGIAERRSQWDAFYLDFFRRAVSTVSDQKEPPSSEHVEQEASRLLREFQSIGERDRRRTFVSCWHANTIESEALWRLYCPPPMMGVAIQTDARLLTEALGNDPQIKLGRVQYVDFRKAFAGFYDRIYWKRRSLSHEAEVRAVIQRLDVQEDVGLAISIDIQKLLLSVVPSPFAPGWFASLIESTMRRFGVDSNVSRSELLSKPFF